MNKFKTVLFVVVLIILTGCAHKIVWKKTPDVAQYKGADWKNEIKRVSGLTLESAMKIGKSDTNITFFFYMKEGAQLYLDGKPGPDGWTEKGVFREGDAVFFSGKPWYGSAPGYSDAYEKQKK
jgi:hypothetical protein